LCSLSRHAVGWFNFNMSTTITRSLIDNNSLRLPLKVCRVVKRDDLKRVQSYSSLFINSTIWPTLLLSLALSYRFVGRSSQQCGRRFCLFTLGIYPCLLCVLWWRGFDNVLDVFFVTLDTFSLSKQLTVSVTNIRQYWFKSNKIGPKFGRLDQSCVSFRACKIILMISINIVSTCHTTWTLGYMY
jgi:hypothetical protein